MEDNKIISEQSKIIDEQNKKIKVLEDAVKVLGAKVANTARAKLTEEIESTKDMVKKNKKFDVKMWLLTSSFAICSCVFGLVNLILNLTKR